MLIYCYHLITQGGNNMEELRKAIGYIRVSTEAQDNDDRFGVDAQRHEIEKYAKNNGYTIVHWEIDKMSGASDNRPALDRILYGSDVMNPPFEAVIGYKSDRFARDTKLYFYYLYTLEKKNVKLISTQENFDDEDGFANIYRSLLMFVAEQERKNIALRTKGGRMMKASNGGYSGGKPPYGYRAKNKCLIIDENEAEIVRYCFENYDRGKSEYKIASDLRDLGYKSHNGKYVQDTTVNHIIKNRRFYQGYYKYGKMGKWVKGVHTPIIPDYGDEFE